MAEQNLQEDGRLVYSKSHIIAGWTNLLAAGSVGAAGVVAAVRNIGPAELIVDGVEMGFITTTVATAAGSVGFAFYKVPGFTALSNAGARATAPVPVRKRNADHFALPAATVVDPRFDTAVQVQVADVGPLSGLTISPALVAGDPQDVLICRSVLAATTPTYIYEGDSIWVPKNRIPLTLGPDEGLVFASLQALPAALVGRFGFSADVRIA